MKYTPNIKQEDFMIYPTFKDERIETFKNEEFTPEKYIDILSNLTIRMNNIKQIILFLTNENMQNNENNYINLFIEHKINIKAFLTHIYFIKRRINLYLELYQKKIKINDYIEENKDPFSLQKSMYEEYSLKSEFNHDYDLFFDLHKKEYASLIKIKTLGNEYEPNFNMLFIGMKILNLYLNDALIIFKTFLNSKKLSDVKDEQKLKLCKLLFIIQTIGLIICDFYFIDRNNIFNIKEKEKEWNKIKNKMKRISVSSKINIMNTLEDLSNNLSILYSSMNSLETHSSNNYILDTSLKGGLMAYYYLRKQEAKFEADKFKINPDLNICKKVWRLSEVKESKKLLKIVLPNIEFRQTFYIARNEYDIINNESINEMLEKIQDPNFEINVNNKSINSISSLKKMLAKEPKLKKRGAILENENPDSEVGSKRSNRFKSKKELKSINKQQKKLNYIKTILIHNSSFKTNLPDENDSFLDKLFCCNSNPRHNHNISKDSIILHIHGGGFITLSPLSHENYTRKIVNKTGIATLSVDYRLSPEYSFPCALDDVYQVYTWLIENGEGDLNLKIKNIILLGDSAGGNLILSLVYILLIRGMRLPNFIILAYPSVKMNIVPLSLSYLNSIYDPMLDSNLLYYCRNSYLGDNTEDMNPFLSPIYMEDKILKNFPKIKIYGGTGDPLRDDYVEFFHKLFNAKVDCEFIEFNYFCHGFLNYDYSFIMPQADECTKMISEDIENYTKIFFD